MEGQINSRFGVKQNIEDNISDFDTYSFSDKSINHLGPIIDFIRHLAIPNENNDDINDADSGTYCISSYTRML
jgi:hypothetical protein